jgi:hypothetical protein
MNLYESPIVLGHIQVFTLKEEDFTMEDIEFVLK